MSLAARVLLFGRSGHRQSLGLRSKRVADQPSAIPPARREGQHGDTAEQTSHRQKQRMCVGDFKTARCVYGPVARQSGYRPGKIKRVYMCDERLPLGRMPVRSVC